MPRINPYQVYRVKGARTVDELAELCQRNFDAIEDELRTLDDIMRLRVVVRADTEGDGDLEPNTLTVVTGAGGTAFTLRLPPTLGNDGVICIVKAQMAAAAPITIEAQPGDSTSDISNITTADRSQGYICQEATKTWGRTRW